MLQLVALPPHSFRFLRLILSSGYVRYGVAHVLPVLVWIPLDYLFSSHCLTSSRIGYSKLRLGMSKSGNSALRWTSFPFTVNSQGLCAHRQTAGQPHHDQAVTENK